MSNWLRDLYGVNTLTEISSSATISSNALDIDLRSGTVFYVPLNADITTFTISGVRTPGASSFTLIFTADGTQRAITWPGSVSWNNGLTPTPSQTNGVKDIYSFMTLNAGTNWYGFISGQNFA